MSDGTPEIEPATDEACLPQSALLYDDNGIVSQIVGEHIVVTIPKLYLKRSVECGITTGSPAKVIDENEMMECYSHGFMSFDDGGDFNHCIDSIARDALEQGEPWLDAE